MEAEHQVPIWFFIGCVLLVYGLIVSATGVYLWIVPPPEEARVKLYEYHADVWWGMVMILFGGLYCVRFWPRGNSSYQSAPQRREQA